MLHSSSSPASDSGERDPCCMEHLAFRSLVSCQGHCDSYNYCSFITIWAGRQVAVSRTEPGASSSPCGLSHWLQEKPTQKLSCSGERADRTPLGAGRIVLHTSSSCASGQTRKQGSPSSASLHEAMVTASLLLPGPLALAAATLTCSRRCSHGLIGRSFSMFVISHSISPTIFLSFMTWQHPYFCPWQVSSPARCRWPSSGGRSRLRWGTAGGTATR